ncbi:Fe-S cluster assembly ATPase SufC [Candidatus Uhrbacteria bacterium]|nr:Fe-S cluster assembly ATPase SufC [Candidatus Uhrbacteria bacterium]
MPPLLIIKDLSVSVAGKDVVRGVSLTMKEGEVHAIMGPNGSGKSSLVNALMGHPLYAVTGGSVKFCGKDLLKLSPDERALAGLFLAFQYPKEIAGVPLRSFLLAAHRTRPEKGKRLSPLQFDKVLTAAMKELHMDATFADRSLNQGFSGGEKKKAEVLQMKILKPLLALLDETDSGLDVDALKIVAAGVNELRSMNKELGKKKHNSKFTIHNSSFSALIVTHYARILEHITPDHVHVMVGGKIVESGGAEFARRLEREGYRKYGEEKEKIRFA